jgi:hypothetical protein
MIAKKALETFQKATCAVIIAAISPPDLSTTFLGKEHVYTAGETILLAAALGLNVWPGLSLWRNLLPPWWCALRHQSDCRVFQGHIQVRRDQGHQILDAPLCSEAAPAFPSYKRARVRSSRLVFPRLQ